LLPRDPAARAFARMTEEICDTHYEAVTWGFSEVVVFGRATGALAETLRAAAARQTAVLQDWLAARLGSAAWFGGTTFGWADAAVAPLLHRSVLNDMGPPPGSALTGWYERLQARPSVATTFAEYAASAAQMPATVEAFKTGRKVREYRDHRLSRLCLVAPHRQDLAPGPGWQASVGLAAKLCLAHLIRAHGRDSLAGVV
jgi:RNA polymerase-associated protein